MTCEKTPETLMAIQESVGVFVALSDYSIEEIMMDKNLLDALNKHVNNDLVDKVDMKYGSIIINMFYKK